MAVSKVEIRVIIEKNKKFDRSEKLRKTEENSQELGGVSKRGKGR